MRNGKIQHNHLPAGEHGRVRTSTHPAERLRAAGQRVTAQRLVILEALRPGEHISADEVLSRVESQLPAVNRSTIYRTLELYRDLGLVSETDLGGGARQFELIEERRHHHLICHSCGAITAFDDALLHPLRQALNQQYAFTATIDHLAVFGWCAACKDEQRVVGERETHEGQGEGPDA